MNAIREATGPSETHQHFSSALEPVVLHKSFHVYGTPNLRCFAAKNAPLLPNSQCMTWRFVLPGKCPIRTTFSSFEINAFSLQWPQSIWTLKLLLKPLFVALNNTISNQRKVANKCMFSWFLVDVLYEVNSQIHKHTVVHQVNYTYISQCVCVVSLCQIQ